MRKTRTVYLITLDTCTSEDCSNVGTLPPQLNNKARFGYTWKDKGPVATPVQDKVRSLFKAPTTLLDDASKKNVKVTEQGKVLTIEFENFIFTVESKS